MLHLHSSSIPPCTDLEVPPEFLAAKFWRKFLNITNITWRLLGHLAKNNPAFNGAHHIKSTIYMYSAQVYIENVVTSR